jgi:hypothetical protein
MERFRGPPRTNSGSNGLDSVETNSSLYAARLFVRIFCRMRVPISQYNIVSPTFTWVITSGEAVWVKRPHMLLYIEGYAVRGEVSSSLEIRWSGSANGSASFDSEAAAVGRAETGSFRLFGLFSLSRSMGYLIGQPKKPNEPNKPKEPEKPERRARS